MQQDAAEFLVKLLDSFSADPLMRSIFTGKTKMNIVCYDCNERREVVEDFSILNVPIQKGGWRGLEKRADCYCRGYGGGTVFSSEKGKHSFVSMIQHGSGESYLLENGLESLFLASNGKCEKCGSKNCDVVTAIEELPEVLILQLNRYGKRWFGVGKFYYHVSYPVENVDFSKFLPETVECENCKYDLFSVVFHSGFMNSGHYQCFSKCGGEWYLFNDSVVTKVDIKTVLSEQCFILFYQKHVSQEVKNIRQNIMNKSQNLDVGVPIFCLSDRKKWLNSVPYSQDDDLFEEANAYAGGKVTRNVTDDDLRQRFIFRLPFSTLEVPISYQYGRSIFNYIVSNEPLTDESQTQDDCYLTGKEILLFSRN